MLYIKGFSVGISCDLGPFQLARMTLDEYILLITETQFCKQEEKQLQNIADRLIKGKTTSFAQK